MQVASIVSGSFTVVTTLGRSVPAIEYLARRYGYADLCRKVRASEIPSADRSQIHTYNLRNRADGPPRGREYSRGKTVQSDDKWRAFIRETAIGVYHPAGTCKMGHDRMAVVDDRLRVHGIEELYVVDASSMPFVVRVRTSTATAS